MFCKNCGNQLDDVAAICVKCGATRGIGSNFCANCGQPINPGSAYCTNCGAPSNFAGPTAGAPYGAPIPGQKSKIAAGILGILLGGLGIHNFYLGYTGKALTQLLISVLTCGILAFPMAIWGLIEGIQILTGSINVDANGVPLGD